MNRKLNECKSCEHWDNKKNKMKNMLWCMFDSDARIAHQTKIAIMYNRNTGSKRGEFEHGKEVL